MKQNPRIVISGGGTGGHIFPALAIANGIKAKYPNAAVLFVGAEGKMEMEKVPAAGYEIIGLPIVGFQRRLTYKNLLLPFKLIASLLKAKSILKSFQPDVVIGVGGYASGPTLKMAQRMNIPTVVQEQNSFPGKTNRLLAKQVAAVCTAYEGLETVFPKEKIHFTGNPVRAELQEIQLTKAAAFAFFPELNPAMPTILVMGGSLGARTLNEGVLFGLEQLNQNGIQVLWQCGKYYASEMKETLAKMGTKNVFVTDFISRMDAAYALSDVIVSRAGALSISELCLVGKPVILIPSPNVSEDHQTKNAMALVQNNAAILIKDTEAKERMVQRAVELIGQMDLRNQLGEAILSLAKPKATESIIEVIEGLIKE
jgi:UDP-N-acetylglucosamine--N-acetylmuramyl-(pentapeptide) pyrophosphoryl-undecaprenol N-acetylglucosamine transferase